MISLPVKPQKGATLLELTIALSLGGLVIIAAFYFFLSTLSVSHSIQSQALMKRKLNEAQSIIRNEVKQAGFQINKDRAIQFKDFQEILYCSEAENELGVVYQNQLSGTQAFRHVVFKFNPHSHKLLQCDKYASSPLTVESAKVSTASAHCYSMFDENVLKVTSFDLHCRPIEGTVEHSLFIEFTLGVESISEQTLKEVSTVKVTARSWNESL